MAVGFNISEIRELSEQLSVRLNMPFRHMTHSFLKRRLAMFFEKHGFRKIENLYESIRQPEFVDDLSQFFSINTTELFRDAGFWRQLRKIFNEKFIAKDCHVWFPDVASGEELYSLLILVEELKIEGNVQITVNHQSKTALTNIQKGLLSVRKMDTNAYNYKRFEGISSIDSYFVEKPEGINFKSDRLKKVNYQQGGIENIPSKKCDIVIMRNNLLYFTKDYHVTIKEFIDECLNKGGYVCLGVKEQLPVPYNDRFECIDKKEKIFSKFSFLRD